jgi:preprotein translocase subunit SecA
VYTAQAIARWANFKYRRDYVPEHFQERDPQQIYEELVAVNREFLLDGKLEEEIDQALAGKDEAEAVVWGKQRFGPAWKEARFSSGDGGFRERLLDQGREMLRYELARLEQAVLLRLHDQCWKDHLWEMDHLKMAIMQRPMGGDQTHPQSQYAIEGRELFDQMWSRIRDRVTELILKARMGGGPARPGVTAGPGATGPGPVLQMRHADATGAGFAQAEADQRAAMRAQGVDQKVETIRRKQPRVGRNDPCPCGSGKKYKHCHGRM